MDVKNEATEFGEVGPPDISSNLRPILGQLLTKGKIIEEYSQSARLPSLESSGRNFLPGKLSYLGICETEFASSEHIFVRSRPT